MTNPTLTDIVGSVTAHSAPDNMTTAIIAIDGCGGAGKTTLSERLATRLDAQVIHIDDFASWDNPLNWHDRLIQQVLQPLHANTAARYQRFDWSTNRLAEWHNVPVQPFVILEGVSSARIAFRKFLSFAIFVDTPSDICLQRGLARDGADAAPLWRDWQAAEAAYLVSDAPQDFADLKIDGTQSILK